MKTRYINKIELSNGSIKKTSATHSKKLEMEYNWMQAMSKNQFIPWVNKIENGYEIEYIEGNNLGEKFWGLGLIEKKWYLSLLIDFIENNVKDVVVDENWLKSLLFDKFVSRMKESEDLGLINNGNKWIWNAYLRNFEEYFELIKNVKNLYGIVHGDLFFGNTMFNEGVIKIIDPRGINSDSELYGNLYYDIIKLAHSVDGKYDVFIYEGSKIKHWKKVQKFYFKEMSKKFNVSSDLIKFGEISLFLSMLPLHIDDKDRIEHFIRVAERLSNDLGWKEGE